MNILLVGGFGFIGSYLARRFLDEGHAVTVLDSLQWAYTTPPPNQLSHNLHYRHAHLLAGAAVVRASTLDRDATRRLVQNVHPSLVVHLATPALVKIASERPEEAFDNTLKGTANLLNIARDSDFVERFVYASSSMVYGDFITDPVPEEAPTAPKNLYGSLKLAGEVLVRGYSDQFGLRHTIVRPSSVYGPTDHHRRVVSVFLDHAMRGIPIQVFNPDTNLADFTHVKDTALAIQLASLDPAGADQTFNITRSEGRTLGELVSILRQHFPNLRTEETTDLEHGRPRRGALDITKAKELLGYEPKYSLEAGIANCVAFLRAESACDPDPPSTTVPEAVEQSCSDLSQAS